MREPAPVLAADLFPEERALLLDLLSGLTDDEWALPTACPGWSVKDVALHILGDDVGIISHRRDGHTIAAPEDDSWEALVAFLNRWNEAWVDATRRISPRLLVALLRTTGDEAARYFASLDPFETGGPVSWAGPGPAPVWLDVAREYTERWLHQQQIRDAASRPGAKEPRLFAPVLATFVHALPHAYRDSEANDGVRVDVTIAGEAGGRWSVARLKGSWKLVVEAAGAADAHVELDQETAWRLFTRGLTRELAVERARVSGDEALGMNVLDAVAIIA